MKVQFDDTMANWKLWGELVDLWVRHPERRPLTAGDLKDQMAVEGIAGASVPGNPSRPVTFINHDDDAPLTLVVPPPNMVRRSVDEQPDVSDLPSFYNLAFLGAHRTKLSPQLADTFAMARRGEYSIQYCL